MACLTCKAGSRARIFFTLKGVVLLMGPTPFSVAVKVAVSCADIAVASPRTSARWKHCPNEVDPFHKLFSTPSVSDEVTCLIVPSLVHAQFVARTRHKKSKKLCLPIQDKSCRAFCSFTLAPASGKYNSGSGAAAFTQPHLHFKLARG